MENPSLEFTKDARVVMLLAAQIAREAGSTTITPEHILLGILRNPDCGAMQTLRILGLPVADLRTQVEERIPRSATALPDGEDPIFSEDTNAIMQEAAREAKNRRLEYIDTSLILLGILLNALLPVSALLRMNGLRLETFRDNTRFERPEGNSPLNSTPRKAVISNQSSRQAQSRTNNNHIPAEVSPIFIGMVLFTITIGVFMFFGILPAKLGVFLFVTGGWLISLCLHEFGHALTAYLNGDYSVAMQGYLSLNPFRYTQWMTSILLPLLFIIAGGIALPGGAVFVNLMAIRSPGKRSFVSASGPLMNLAFLILLAIILIFGRLTVFASGAPQFWAGISLLAFFQIVALVLNLLPIPGMDGFGIIAPFLPENVQYAAQTFGRFGYLLLFALLWINSPISNAFWNIISHLAGIFGVNAYLVNLGFSFFRFWM